MLNLVQILYWHKRRGSSVEYWLVEVVLNCISLHRWIYLPFENEQGDIMRSINKNETIFYVVCLWSTGSALFVAKASFL